MNPASFAERLMTALIFCKVYRPLCIMKLLREFNFYKMTTGITIIKKEASL